MKSSKPKYKRVRPLLGTFVSIELQGAAAGSSFQGWISQGFEAIEEVDHLMSMHRPDSDISRLNRAAAGEWVELNPLTFHVLQASNRLFEVSGGVFDIRCGSVTAGSPPPLKFRAASAQKTGPGQLDLGGIAKGYAVDRAVERMQRCTAGLPISGSVNAGGDMRLWGRGAVPAAAQVRGTGAFWLRPFVIREAAVATSSVRMSNDSTLAPAVHRIMPSGQALKKEQTVTVFAKQCLWADALTKIVLLASERLARACLASCQAKALVFNPNGTLQTVMG
jgi:thiamine biosynthesis lipoprotein